MVYESTFVANLNDRRQCLYNALYEAAKASKIAPEMLNELKMCDNRLALLLDVVGFNENYMIAIRWWEKPIKHRVALFNRIA